MRHSSIAAEMPYGLDLIRLATSALAMRQPAGIAAEGLCAAILGGYRRGLAAPHPLIVDRDLGWLRELVVVSEKQRANFWKKIERAQPEPRLAMKTARRTAGSGSLGRPRWIGVAHWRGAPVVREAKAVLVSAWDRANGRGKGKLRCGDIASGRHRAVDPWFHVKNGIAVRRLSPNNRKIEADDDAGALLSPPMLETMGFELASVHLGTADCSAAIAHHLSRRKASWLLATTRRMAAAVEREHAAWKASGVP